MLIHLLFPQLAPDYLRGPEPAAKAPRASTSVPAPEAAAPAATPAPEPEPAAPPAVATAEFDVEVEGEIFKVRVSGAGMTVVPDGGAASTPAAAPASLPTGEGTVIAPMQGLIVKLPVKAGDDVKLGDVVAVLEAMKMQNDIVTTVAGKVREVYVKEGEVVTPSQPLLAVG